MSLRSLVVLAILTAVLAVPAFAMRPYTQTIFYFDEYGSQIGTYWAECLPTNDSSTGTTTGDSYVIAVGGPCTSFEPFTCADVGLYSISSCPDGLWCVSQGYKDAYEDWLVPDCEDNYKPHMSNRIRREDLRQKLHKALLQEPAGTPTPIPSMRLRSSKCSRLSL